MVSIQTKRWIGSSLLMVWSILAASCATASYVKRKEEIGTDRWTFAHTSPWIAVVQVISALSQIPYPRYISGRSINTILALLFLALHIGAVAPVYVQTDIWDAAANLPNGRFVYMKLDVASMVFAGLGVIQAFATTNDRLQTWQRMHNSQIA